MVQFWCWSFIQQLHGRTWKMMEIYKWINRGERNGNKYLEKKNQNKLLPTPPESLTQFPWQCWQQLLSSSCCLATRGGQDWENVEVEENLDLFRHKVGQKKKKTWEDSQCSAWNQDTVFSAWESDVCEFFEQLYFHLFLIMCMNTLKHLNV